MTKVVSTNVPYTDANVEMLNSVLGQLGDGIWENSSYMWRIYGVIGDIYFDKSDDGKFITINVTDKSTLIKKSDEYIRKFFSNKLRRIVGYEQREMPTNIIWSPRCTVPVGYLCSNDRVTVKDVYMVRELLKGD